MLRRFLLIGVGGSGGKTLRYLRQDLEQRLLEVGWTEGIPVGWQFLTIDVPPSPDGNEPGLPPQLPDGSYVGLAVQNVSYAALDRVLVPAAPNERNLRELVGWRPNPANVFVDIAAGAGQHRTLGRVIAVANLGKIKSAISGAIERMSQPDATTQLDRLSQAFGNQPTNNPPMPVALVTSSIAGGSGAGIFLDVCDVLKSTGQSWADNSMAVLFAPDVFADLPQLGKNGVYPNALAALSEMLAGYWNNEPTGATEYALYESAGIQISGSKRRGPRYPFVIGRSNQRVHFGGQLDVYQGTGSALAALLTSATAQNDLVSYKFGNWTNSTSLPDNLGLKTPNDETPLSSLGFASVSLGRDRFGRYASERLARLAVEHVLRAHWVGREVPEKMTPEEALEEAREPNFNWFLEESGLHELGETNNEIVDGLRPPTQAALIEETVQRVRSNVVGGRKSLKASEWSNALCGSFKANEQQFLGDIQVRIETNARDVWIPEMQTKIRALVAKAMAMVGGPVTVALLDSLLAEIARVVGELTHEQDKYRRWTLNRDGAIQDGLAQFGDRNQMPADNEFLSRAIDQGRKTLEWGAEAELRAFAADIVRDLSEGLLMPLRSAVAGAVAVLEQEDRPAAGNGVAAVVREWPDGELVPKRYEPAVNERLVEPVGEFPAMFRDRIEKTIDATTPDGAQRQAVTEIVLGSKIATEQQCVQQKSPWWPDRLSSASAVPSRARFEVSLNADSLLNRARLWVHAPNTAIGSYVSESMSSYVGSGVDEATRVDRMERLRASFAEALSLAAPLVNLNASVLSRVHERDSMKPSFSFTEIPFAVGTPGRTMVEAVLRSQDIDPTDPVNAKFFGDGDQSRIDIVSMFDVAMEPVVFDSIMAPIAADWTARKNTAEARKNFWKWRRSRPLTRFAPMAPEVRRRFITGWWTARLLGQLRWPAVTDAGPVEAWIADQRSWMPFPFPLITPALGEADILPAVVESLPLAIVAYATKGGLGDQALMPYRRLSDLGDAPQMALHPWIMSGTVPAGSPVPDERMGVLTDAPDVRRKKVLDYLEGRQTRYAKLIDEPVTTLDFFELRWVWELGEDLRNSFHSLIQVARSTDTAGEDSD